MNSFDIIFVADPRFPGGTSTAVASEIEAAASHGYRSGLLALKAPVLGRAHAYHPQIRGALDQGLAQWLDPEEAWETNLLLMHHPQVATHLPVKPLRLKAEQRRLIIQHPPFDARGTPYYPTTTIARNVDWILGGPTAWAPVGPLCRHQFERLAECPALTDEDWHSIVDPSGFERPHIRPQGPNLIIGRHSRPDPQKWPDSREAILQAYPESAPFDVRILGGGKFLNDLMGTDLPANWRVAPFKPDGVPEFLQALDVYVYYHHSNWVEAFGRTLIEAMAAGVPLVIEPHFEPLFGEAALYAERIAAPDVALELATTPGRWERAQAAGFAKVADSFSPAALVRRLNELIGPPHPATVAKSEPTHNQAPIRSRALFITSNGIGLGHLTRIMAITRRLPTTVEPIIVTMSQAAKLAEDAGLTCHFIPFHSYLAVDNQRWNHFLRLELIELFRLLEPRVIVFDGNMPYGGLIDAMRDYGGGWRVWIRRAMWKQNKASEIAIGRERSFDMVIEPGDLTQEFDRGPTTTASGLLKCVSPIRLIDADDGLGRDAARKRLDLDLDGDVILVQLGSGNNYDYRLALSLIAQAAEQNPSTRFVCVESPIADEPLALPDIIWRRRHYPLGEALNAFDGAISAAGYNSFHELLGGGIPTLFLPNENPSMDDQGRRARIAARHGWAAVASAQDSYALVRGIDNVLNPTWRAEISQQLLRISDENGAVEAASLLQEMMMTMRADID